MARCRLMPPDWAKDERLAATEPLARLLFYHLHNIADRAGRLEDRPRRIAVECLPYDRVDVEPLLTQLADHGLIVRYNVDGVPYLAIPTFLIYQSPHLREKNSSIPPIPESLGLSGASTELAPDSHSPRSPVSVSGFDLGSDLGSVSGSKTVKGSKSETGRVLGNPSPSKQAVDDRRLLKFAREALELTDPNDEIENLVEVLKWHVRDKNIKFTNEQGKRAIQIALDDRKTA